MSESLALVRHLGSRVDHVIRRLRFHVSTCLIHYVTSVELDDCSLTDLACFRYYVPVVILFCFVIPSCIPTLWGESLWTSYFVGGLLRYFIILHSTWLVNSAAHIWGE